LSKNKTDDSGKEKKFDDIFSQIQAVIREVEAESNVEVDKIGCILKYEAVDQAMLMNHVIVKKLLERQCRSKNAYAELIGGSEPWKMVREGQILPPLSNEVVMSWFKIILCKADKFVSKILDDMIKLGENWDKNLSLKRSQMSLKNIKKYHQFLTKCSKRNNKQMMKLDEMASKDDMDTNLSYPPIFKFPGLNKMWRDWEHFFVKLQHLHNLKIVWTSMQQKTIGYYDESEEDEKSQKSDENDDKSDCREKGEEDDEKNDEDQDDDEKSKEDDENHNTFFRVELSFLCQHQPDMSLACVEDLMVLMKKSPPDWVTVNSYSIPPPSDALEYAQFLLQSRKPGYKDPERLLWVHDQWPKYGIFKPLLCLRRNLRKLFHYFQHMSHCAFLNDNGTLTAAQEIQDCPDNMITKKNLHTLSLILKRAGYRGPVLKNGCLQQKMIDVANDISKRVDKHHIVKEGITWSMFVQVVFEATVARVFRGFADLELDMAARPWCIVEAPELGQAVSPALSE